MASTRVRRKTYAHLLKDADVKRWHENVSRGSYVTADVYLRRLGSFCTHFKKEPSGLAALSESELYNLMLDYVSFMEKSGKTGSYIKSALKAVKSWLSHNGKEVRRKIKIKGSEDTPSLKEERVPTTEELKRILLSGDKKARVACALIAHSGLRTEVLGNYRGDDGLRISDLPEIKIENDVVNFGKSPTQILVRKELSKAGHQYFTFLSEEGVGHLKDYLEERLRDGEKLGPSSAVITPKQKMKPFIRTGNIGDAIREAIRTAGFRWRPYVLRSYFDTQLMLAESKGLVLRDYRQFWMGHKGDIENRYTTNKHRLPESVIEDMRGAYKRSQVYLQTTESTPGPSDMVKEAKIEALKSIAKNLLGIDLLEIKTAKERELQKELNRDEEIQLFETEIRKTRDEEKKDPQTIVSEEQLDQYLAQGWQFVSSLPSRKIIIKKTD